MLTVAPPPPPAPHTHTHPRSSCWLIALGITRPVETRLANRQVGKLDRSVNCLETMGGFGWQGFGGVGELGGGGDEVICDEVCHRAR